MVVFGGTMVVLCVTLVVLIGKEIVVGGIRWYATYILILM